MRVLDNSFDHPLESEEHASAPFAGGIKQHGYQCGMIWGAALAAGAQAYQILGAGPQAEYKAIMASQKLLESFRTNNKYINCLEITEIDKSSSAMKMIVYFLIKGGTIGCIRKASKFAPIAFNDINTVLAEEIPDIPSPPISCAALLAQKMGVSEKHIVMASGFAGGIGLSGAACGALGAAIWIKGMNLQMEHENINLWKDEIFNSEFDNLIERFLKKTDFEFECSKIVRRNFKNINDHAEYLRGGGCSEIIDILTAK